MYGMYDVMQSRDRSHSQSRTHLQLTRRLEMVDHSVRLRLRLHQLDVCNVLLGMPHMYDEQLMYA